MMNSIAVIGATGMTGSATVRELSRKGFDPLCVVRDRDRARSILGERARVAIADIDSRADLATALRGVDRLMFVTGRSRTLREQQVNILEAAREAGVDFALKVSGARGIVGRDSVVMLGRDHYHVEQMLQSVVPSWCILRPGLFMQNTLEQGRSVTEQSNLVIPCDGDLKLSFIDVRDTAAVAAEILVNPDRYRRRLIELTGRQTTYNDFAGIFSKVLGRPIFVSTISPEGVGERMSSLGSPPWLIEHSIAIARTIANGGFTPEQCEPIREVLGREPISTLEFVQDHKEAFQ
ncbi:Uncharacterized conserved protein YbjT, contains NAD(P)-binding and DUF2867 domains [Bradyrhizobium sp. Rc3b]|uniref:NmrA family NAD(P)-binding protein n=1 Tax=Bradyrhizobium sp. Rc3b TaxID=1855322 RepID=UPI0008E0FBEC|nr:NmrA family NAD(P)-binding protein [Bradyrhizobium sp. Rc3b]SFM49590.1 Uncharacterized conserved protein YbjT, contains NAD(P)-binding and DUF2867 domains [Bradyrhizobium sp. Rc3b]